MSKELWRPSAERIQNSRLSEFTQYVEHKTGMTFTDYQKLHDWSCHTNAQFWDVLWDFCEVVGDKGERVIRDESKMPGAEYFPEAKLNYAENLLKFKGGEDAIVFRSEDKVEQRISRDQLRLMVARFQQGFIECGLTKGDRVAAMLPNMPETIAAMLAVTALGGIWSSCSPDFGVRGVLDRFGQIDPKIFLSCDGYWYNGKRIDINDKLKDIIPGLKCKTNVIIPLLGFSRELTQSLENTLCLEDFLPLQAGEIHFERVEFRHPLYILFSSGTTGVPKCIVHGHGGSLLKVLGEHQLQSGLSEGDRMFYFTTCGWMMWNWLVAGLASGITLLLFDGSPFAPNERAIFDYIEKEQATFFGTSAKFIDAVRNTGFKPIEACDFSSVNVIASTGSPLAPENFEFVYSGIKKDVHLASMSGGTDIMGCFVMGVSWKSVYSGEIQGKALGMAVEVWDDEGYPTNVGKGELMCVKPFPSMPVMFWNDVDGEKYHQAYFDKYPNVWCHGDYAEWTEHGGMIIHGRSDATLNPGGVRIGTAEIYNQVEQMPEVEEGLCIGQPWDNDVRVVLFVKLSKDVKLDEALITKIKQKIKTGASPRHVPAKIIEVADIPRTKSGKITELAVRDVVLGKQVKNREALANPQALDLFVNLPQLAQ